MKLEDILQNESLIEYDDIQVYTINGSIKPDHSKDFIRIYVNPLDYSSYFLIKKDDIKGDIYEWTSQELSQFGFIGEEMHRIKLKIGTKIQSVKITFESLGETIAGNILYNPNNTDSPGQCRKTSGCAHYSCCQGSGIGGKCYCSHCCEA